MGVESHDLQLPKFIWRRVVLIHENVFSHENFPNNCLLQKLTYTSKHHTPGIEMSFWRHKLHNEHESQVWRVCGGYIFASQPAEEYVFLYYGYEKDG